MSTPTEPNGADRELAPTANDVIETLLGHVDSEKHEQALKLLWQYRDAHRSSAVAEAVAEARRDDGEIDWRDALIEGQETGMKAAAVTLQVALKDSLGKAEEHMRYALGYLEKHLHRPTDCESRREFRAMLAERDSLKQAVAGLEAKITQLEILIGREKAEVEFHRKDAAPRLKKVLNHLHQHMEEIIAIESSHRDTPDNATLSTARNALKYEHL